MDFVEITHQDVGLLTSQAAYQSQRYWQQKGVSNAFKQRFTNPLLLLVILY
jgi:hypothetical protein